MPFHLHDKILKYVNIIYMIAVSCDYICSKYTLVKKHYYQINY